MKETLKYKFCPYLEVVKQLIGNNWINRLFPNCFDIFTFRFMSLVELAAMSLKQQYVYMLFKASALWADAFYKSKCPYVCLCVRLSVCVSTFEVPFKRLFAPTS